MLTVTHNAKLYRSVANTTTGGKKINLQLEETSAKTLLNLQGYFVTFQNVCLQNTTASHKTSQCDHRHLPKIQPETSLN